jgi:hypothetical protein
MNNKREHKGESAIMLRRILQCLFLFIFAGNTSLAPAHCMLSHISVLERLALESQCTAQHKRGLKNIHDTGKYKFYDQLGKLVSWTLSGLYL